MKTADELKRDETLTKVIFYSLMIFGVVSGIWCNLSSYPLCVKIFGIVVVGICSFLMGTMRGFNEVEGW